MKLVLVDDRAALLPLGPTGMTAAAIARHLGISSRTVRRPVGALREAASCPA